MIGRLFSIAVAVSLVICALTGAMWARSYSATAFLAYSGPRAMWNLQSVDGILRYVRNDFRRNLPFHNGQLNWRLSDPPLDPRALKYGASPWVDEKQSRHWLGFVFAESKPAPYEDGILALSRTIVIIVPHWALLAVSGILPLAWLTSRSWRLCSQRRMRRKQRRRLAAGKCPACGYDLAGNTTGACPECGASIGAETPIKTDTAA